MNTTPKPSQIVLMASGAVAFVFSFLPFFEINYGFSSESVNAWSGDGGTLFIASWTAVFGLIVGGLVAAVVFGNVSLPERILTFSWKQIYFVLSFAGFIIMLGYLIGGPSGADKGFGFWLMLLGSIGLLAGSVMELLDDEAAAPSAGPNNPTGGANPF
ncbi:MAG: hypothetical protein ABI239_08390 [Aquihabitans sp.]